MLQKFTAEDGCATGFSEPSKEQVRNIIKEIIRAGKKVLHPSIKGRVAWVSGNRIVIFDGAGGGTVFEGSAEEIKKAADDIRSGK